MRNRKLWVASALLVALAVVGMTMADSTDAKAGGGRGKGKGGGAALQDGGGPGGRRGRGGPGGGRGGLTVDQIVDRIMSFDKNKDGKITKDELPERLQNLIEKGDTNKDGALDKDEIKALATKLQTEGFGGFGRFGGFPGFGGGRGFGPGAPAERALTDLNLSDQKKKDAAEALVKAHEENVKKLMELARSELLLKMKDVLSDEEYKKFKTELESRPGFGGRGR
jgi:hypothetical protein